MKALLLDGSNGMGVKGTKAILEKELGSAGFEVTVIDLAGKEIADCKGCFGCWVRTPGECVIKDDAGPINRQLMQTDLIVLYTPITYGGYSYDLKKALDRSICRSLPFMKKYGGEVHHPLRYDIEQKLMVVGVLRDRDDEAQRCFTELAERNALNMHIGSAAVVLAYLSEGENLTRIAVKEAIFKLVGEL